VANYVEFSVDKNPWCGESISGLRAYCDPDVFEGITDDFYHNNGDGTFSNWTDKAGIANDRGKGLGVVLGDIDNDGDMDIYVANDKVMNLMYINDGSAHFEAPILKRVHCSMVSALMRTAKPKRVWVSISVI